MANLSKVIYINEEDYSTLLSGGTITKNGVTYSHDPTALYVIKNVSAPEYAETAGYATTAGQATKATQDGNGDVISETYAKKAIIGTLTHSNNAWSCDKTHEELTNAILAGNLVYLTAPGWSSQAYYPKKYPYPDGNGDYNSDLLFQSLESGGYCEQFYIYDDNSIDNEEIDFESYLSEEGYFKQRIILKLTIGNNNTLSFKNQVDQDINIVNANWLIRRSQDESDVVVQYNNREYHKQAYESDNSCITFVSIDPEDHLLYYILFNCSTSSTVTLIESASISIPAENVDLGQGYGVSSDSAASAVRTSSISGFELKEGGIVSIKFTTNIEITNPNLNISSTGAKPIYYRGSALPIGTINAGDTVTFMYDGTYYHVISTDVSEVPITRKINNKELSEDITLTASDVGALPSSTVIPDELADLTSDSTHRLVTDAEKSTWNNKQDALVSGTNIKTVDGESLLGTGNIDTTFLVNITYNSGTETYSADETFADIYLAWQNGKDILCKAEEYTLQLYFIDNTSGAYFSALVSDIQTHITVCIAPNNTVTISSEQFIRLSNDLLTTDPGLALDATQGRILKNMITAQQVRVGSVAGKLYRNNVGGTGNFSITGNSGCIPNLVAGTYQVAIYAKSTTQSYKFRFNFGSSVTYDLTATGGIINDFRQITIPSDGTFSGSVVTSSGVANGTILYVVMYNYVTPITTIGPAAVTNNYNDLDGKPSIPTVNNGTLTIQQNGVTVNTFTANQSSNVTANIYSTMFGVKGQNGFERDTYNSSNGIWSGVEIVTPDPLVTYVDIASNKLYRYDPSSTSYVELSAGGSSNITSTAITDLTDIL